MFNFTGTYTDKYQLSMAQVYFLQGLSQHSTVFDYFFRKLPFGGGYAVFAGLDDLLQVLENLRFDRHDLDFLRQQGFHSDFLAYLKNFRFTGNLYAPGEGDVVFPTHPIISIEANIIEAQIIETVLLNIVNFQTLIATKASRMRLVAGDATLIEFGLRRAQGTGAYYASRAAVIGGFEATSNVRAGRDYAIPIAGTMAHSFVQSYADEASAFRDFAKIWPDDSVFLVDTYDTLHSGVPNAIEVGKEMLARGQRLKGIRLDSGDLAYLAKKARHMLDDAGLGFVTITASNQLDEYVIKSLRDQQAPIDHFGVGTSLVTGHADGALDGVYKLALLNQQARIKLSENSSKITLPGKKQVYRLLDSSHCFWGADVVCLGHEETMDTMHHPFEPAKSLSIKNQRKEALLTPHLKDGKRVSQPQSLRAIAQYSQERLAMLPEEYKRLHNPHLYKVGLSEALKQERDHLIQFYKGKSV
ncbi:MAG: nicotinate phosphoribosyltransferase [Legionellaceae bacterium]|nr:nicotinate phosphoribosyltransferase [Legionellaceae bacterium]